MGPRPRRGVPRDDWHGDAACRDADPELFFAPDGESAELRETRETAAKMICGDCPVQNACLAWAMNVEERVGIWGGTTADERRMLRRGAREAAAIA